MPETSETITVGDIIVSNETGERFIVKYFDKSINNWIIELLGDDDNA